MFPIKLCFNKEVRRVTIQAESQLGRVTYQQLVDAARNLFPSLSKEEDVHLTFLWTDDDSDLVCCSTDEELFEAVRVMESEGKTTYRFDVNVVDTKPAVSSKSAEDATHFHVSCDDCGVCPIVGTRYKCSVRNDFDLCEACEQKAPQPFPTIKIYTHEQTPIAVSIELKNEQPAPSPFHQRGCEGGRGGGRGFGHGHCGRGGGGGGGRGGGWGQFFRGGPRECPFKRPDSEAAGPTVAEWEKCEKELTGLFGGLMQHPFAAHMQEAFKSHHDARHAAHAERQAAFAEHHAEHRAKHQAARAERQAAHAAAHAEHHQGRGQGRGGRGCPFFRAPAHCTEAEATCAAAVEPVVIATATHTSEQASIDDQILQDVLRESLILDQCLAAPVVEEVHVVDAPTPVFSTPVPVVVAVEPVAAIPEVAAPSVAAVAPVFVPAAILPTTPAFRTWQEAWAKELSILTEMGFGATPDVLVQLERHLVRPVSFGPPGSYPEGAGMQLVISNLLQ